MDELNAFLGLLVSNLPEKEADLTREIREIQSILFDVGALLSSSAGSPLLQSLTHIGEKDITALERAIDRLEERLSPLAGFILPGGRLCAALAHVSRAVCRRAERHVAPLAVAGKQEVGPVLVYLNRLSDYLFVLARHLNQVMGGSDIPWKKS